MDAELLDQDLAEPTGPEGGGWTAAAPAEGRPEGVRGGSGSAPASALDSYIRSIAQTPILSWKETRELARALEAQEAAFRRALFSIPGTALEVLDRWEERRRAGRVTAALAAGHRDGSQRDWNRHVDTRLRKLQGLVARREPLAGTREPNARRQRTELDSEIERLLSETGIALEIALAIYRKFRELASAPRTRPVAEERRRLGLSTPAARAQLARARRALAQLEETKRTFVSHNLKLVVKLAKTYRNLGVPFLDLIQEGNLGLIRAVEKFDYRRGYRFSTYAVWWIHQAMIRAIQNHSRTVRVPSHIRDDQLRLRRVEQALQHRFGRRPTRGELVEALELKPAAVDRIATTLKPILSIQSAVPGTDDLTLEDALADPQLPDPVDGIERVELGRAIDRVLEGLDPRDRRILEWRFGIGDETPRTLQAIADRIGISRERVRQLEARALRQLRQEREVRRLAHSLDRAVPDAEEGQSGEEGMAASGSRAAIRA